MGRMADKKDETLNSKNVFAALNSLKKKKKSDIKNGSSHRKLEFESEYNKNKEEVFWAPAPLTSKSWADIDDDDDDDYYATTAAPLSAWSGTSNAQDSDAVEEAEIVAQEDENEVEGHEDDDEEEEEEEEEDEHEDEAEVVAEPFIKKSAEVPVHREAERQLSKKELKKKGLEELDAVLAELGYTKQDSSSQDSANVGVQGKKTEADGEVEKKDIAPGEGKAKKKKKKEKASKEAKESQDQSNREDAGNGVHAAADTEQADVSAADVKARLKKVTSAEKKKSGKDTDAATRAAANEAAARATKLAAAKKKEKGHYNQQPVR